MNVALEVITLHALRISEMKYLNMPYDKAEIFNGDAKLVDAEI